MTEALISEHELHRRLEQGTCLAIDCRHELSDPEAGKRAFLAGHVPRARFADLNRDLSSPVTPSTGRHPLPATPDFARFLARVGWHPGVLLVAYDERNNAMSARLWWLMRYHGLPAALLDGGLAAWQSAGYALEAGEAQVEPTAIPALQPNPGMTVDVAQLADDRFRAGITLLDARAPERYSGAVEPLDSAAGHIPGALNRPFAGNLGEDGRFLRPERLREQFAAVLKGREPAATVHYCGSGVTACHNLFAMEWAGLGGSRVYPGSWSEWIRDPGRPIEVST